MEKRLKKKKKQSSSDEDVFQDIYLSKSVSAPVKRTTITKKIKEEKKPINSIALEPPPEIKQMQVEDPNTKKITLEPWNKDKLDKLFSLVLSQANNAQFLTMLRNLLSGCKHTLDIKKKEFKKKWAQLGNSSWRRDEYIRKQQEMKRLEEEQIRQIKQDVISRLGYCKTKGFENKDQIIDAFKITNPGYKYYQIDENEYNRRRLDQINLLEMLMKQPDFVSEQMTSKLMEFTFTSKPIKLFEQIKDNRDRGDEETDNILNKFDNEQNSSVHFLFTKQFVNVNFDKIFENYETCFEVKDSEKFMMSKKSLSWLLDSKSDQIYSNQKFQAETLEKYSNLLKSVHENKTRIEDISQQTRQLLVEICAYMMNSVHYAQKFKLKGPLLHPIDILYVLKKLRNNGDD